MNKFRAMYRITAEIAESEPMHQRLFNQPARPLRPALRALFDRLDRHAARRADRRNMAAVKGSAGKVAHEANAIAAAMQAAGLDPEAPEAYALWDVWQEDGYGAACAALEQKGIAMQDKLTRGSSLRGPIEVNPAPGYADLSASEKALLDRGGAVAFRRRADGTFEKTLEQPSQRRSARRPAFKAELAAIRERWLGEDAQQVASVRRTTAQVDQVLDLVARRKRGH